MNEKRFRPDVIIAVCALFISAIAAAASVYQTRVIGRQTEILNQQFGATTWPYLTFSASYAPGDLQLELRNDGLGPAILRDVSITRDGREVPPGASHSSLNTALLPEIRASIAESNSHKPHGSITTSISSLASGDVIPAGQKINLVHAQGAIVVRHFVSAQPHLGIRVCYCSLLGRCWLKKYDAAGTPPHEVGSCPHSNA